MERQIDLTPQMKQYEDFATGEMRWLPYVMFFNRPGYRSEALNTDSGGFRLSPIAGEAHSLQDNPPTTEANVILGASPAFGFGATSDSETLSALLAGRPRSLPWLNMAAPAFNSTQEALLFQLYRDTLPPVQHVLIFSGLNNLVVAGLPQADGEFPQFFFSGEFFRQMGAPQDIGERMGQPGWARGRWGRAARRAERSAAKEPAAPDPSRRVATAVRNTARDLDVLRHLAPSARLHFVLQPTAAWTDKPYTAEERALIEEADAERAMMWKLFAPILTSQVHAAYAEQLADVCRKRDIGFLDANAAIAASPEARRWLFVDQAHLNDQGNRLVADLMSDELGL